MNRDSFIFYRSFYEAINELPDKEQLEIYKAISDYSLNFNEPKLEGISKTIFILIKPQLDANNKRFINGSKPKKKQKETKTEAEKKQNRSKTEAKQKQNKSKTEAKSKPKETQSVYQVHLEKLKPMFLEKFQPKGKDIDKWADLMKLRKNLKSQNIKLIDFIDAKLSKKFNVMPNLRDIKSEGEGEEDFNNRFTKF